jgi:PAS domain S-box-containing protein
MASVNGHTNGSSMLDDRQGTGELSNFRNGLAAEPGGALDAEGLFDMLPAAACAFDADGSLVRYNRRAAELFGRTPATGESHARLFSALSAGDGDPLAMSPVADVLRSGKPISGRELIVERTDGRRISMVANIAPLFDSHGGIAGAVGCFQQTAERKAAEPSEEERWYRRVLEALPAAVYTTDAAGRITFYNEAAVEMSGRRPELGSDKWCVTWRLQWPDGTPMRHDECPMAVALKEARPIRGAEAIALRPDGREVPFLACPTPLGSANGELEGAVNVLVDLTQLKQAEARQVALIDELNHRVKNTLATVQSLAVLTLRGPQVPIEVRETFVGRLMALSRIHDQLVREKWQSAELRSVVESLLAPFSENGRDRVTLSGGCVTLLPQTALALSMVLNELATNAAKYGALSRPEGRLALSWEVRTAPAQVERRDGAVKKTDKILYMEWQESGGPAVVPPEHRGFGRRLLEQAVAGELHGFAELRFDPEGVRCILTMPLLHGCE